MYRLLVVFSVAAIPVFAQSGTDAAKAAAMANPLSGAAKWMYQMSKVDLLKSAQEMPEENYSFKPVDTVRTFGQLVGHVADGQYEFCSAAVGDKSQHASVEKSKTSKADLIAALQEAFSYCDKAYDMMTDAQAAQMMSFFGHDAPKLSILSFNIAHNMEHYGNMITYLRIKGLVPPSSQKGGMQ
jgi:uncharacterized damage-inducible protein DinB